VRRSHSPDHDDGYLRFGADISGALMPAAGAWVDFIVDCHRLDCLEGYEAFWAGPKWFAKELGEPFLNDAGRRFEASLWTAELCGRPVYLNEVFQREHESLRHEAVNDLLNPVCFLQSLKLPDQPIGIDVRTMPYVTRLLNGEDRHFMHEIAAASKEASYYLLGLGKHTPEPLGAKFSEENRPPLVRSPSWDLYSDQKYWYSKYWNPVVFASDSQQFTSRRWYAFLIPLIAPEFVLNKALSAPGSSAFIVPSEGDWVWAIVASTVVRVYPDLPELVLLSKNVKSRGGDMVWRLPIGTWLQQRRTPYELTQSVRGIEVNLAWLVMHWKRVIRFYQPLLIDFFASRGETLLPVFEG
jgi:hypothetical protein